MARALTFQPMSISPWRRGEPPIDIDAAMARLRDPAAYNAEKLYVFHSDDTGERYGGLNAQEAVELWCVDTRTFITATQDGLIDLRTSSGDRFHFTLEKGGVPTGRYTFEQAAQGLANDGDGLEADHSEMSRSKALKQSYASAQRDFAAALAGQAAGFRKSQAFLEIARDRMNLMADILERNDLEPQTEPELEAPK